MTSNFKDQLKEKMDLFIHFIFKISKAFPKDELYITVSQLKRAALSIILNYIEGYARFKKGNQLNFLEISYGSLKETKYLLDFAKQEKFVVLEDYNRAIKMLDEIGAMLWTEINSLNTSLNN